MQSRWNLWRHGNVRRVSLRLNWDKQTRHSLSSDTAAWSDCDDVDAGLSVNMLVGRMFTSSVLKPRRPTSPFCSAKSHRAWKTIIPSSLVSLPPYHHTMDGSCVHLTVRLSSPLTPVLHVAPTFPQSAACGGVNCRLAISVILSFSSRAILPGQHNTDGRPATHPHPHHTTPIATAPAIQQGCC